MKNTSKATQVSARLRRERALVSYYSNPKHCQQCGRVIPVKDGERPSQTKRRKFCNRSCSTAFNNSVAPKRKANKTGECGDCGHMVMYTRYKDGSYGKRQYCEECGKKRRVRGGKLLEDKTKGELKEASQYWVQWRSQITRHARKVYTEIVDNLKCEICDYDHHIDVCHKTPVADFSNETLVKDINKLDNLIGLCPNHHWDLDHGYLDLAQGGERHTQHSHKM